jgi:NADPH-dependent 2,4-dienoyl-CoA reductase/sulfur reductase-like enzyme
MGDHALGEVVIVGASLAGLRAAEALRDDGFDGAVTMVGAEPHLPYDRPPLSKKVLSGEWEPERSALRRPEEFEKLELRLRLGVRATSLDTANRRVGLDDGDGLAYDGLIIATGAAVRRLPHQPELEGVFSLRTLDDSIALRDALTSGSPRVVVVGAGFIGAEVASTAKSLGCDVTIVEMLPVPLARGLGEEMGSACAGLHRDNGVDLRLGVGIASIEGTARVEGVRLTDGTTIPADVVVVGVGVAPATEWLEGSGLEVRDGLVCDAQLAAGPPGVFAAGDLARWPNGLFGEEMRVEHWTNASEQGAHAGHNLMAWAGRREGPATPYDAVPFFWSDQYGLRIQFLGRAGDGDEVRVVHGAVDDRAFVAVYGNRGRLRGVLGVSRPRLVMGYHRLLASGASWDDALAHAAATE